MFASYPLVIYPWWYLVIDTHWSFSDIMIVLSISVVSHREQSKKLHRSVEEIESIQDVCISSVELSRERIMTKYQRA